MQNIKFNITRLLLITSLLPSPSVTFAQVKGGKTSEAVVDLASVLYATTKAACKNADAIPKSSVASSAATSAAKHPDAASIFGIKPKTDKPGIEIPDKFSPTIDRLRRQDGGPWARSLTADQLSELIEVMKNIDGGISGSELVKLGRQLESMNPGPRTNSALSDAIDGTYINGSPHAIYDEAVSEYRRLANQVATTPDPKLPKLDNYLDPFKVTDGLKAWDKHYLDSVENAKHAKDMTGLYIPPVSQNGTLVDNTVKHALNAELEGLKNGLTSKQIQFQQDFQNYESFLLNARSKVYSKHNQLMNDDYAVNRDYNLGKLSETLNEIDKRLSGIREMRSPTSTPNSALSSAINETSVQKKYNPYR